jgi:uncharacterized protein (TIGR02145 family)
MSGMLNQQIGNYKFLSILGEGGMATVYLAENTLLGKKVAIKVLKQEFVHNRNIRGRFLAEARSMEQVSHLHIISVLDFIDAGDIVAIIMEYVDGQSLREYLDQKGILNDLEIQTVFAQILIALQHVHNLGFIHRDVKPSNFMLTKTGSIKLADFGIAKDVNNKFEMTETGTQMGTPIYMSPEQIKSPKDVDLRSDIYSLGVVLYELVTGKFPFDKNKLTLPEIQVCILRNPLPATDSQWDTQIAKATAKDEIDRFQSCDEWLYLLHRIQMDVKPPNNKDSDVTIEINDYEPSIIDKNNAQDKNSIVKSPKNKKFYTIVFAIILIVIFIILFSNSFTDNEAPVNSNYPTKSDVDSLVTSITYSDQCGNTFQGIELHNQTWMGENLNVIKFSNGDTIPEAKSSEEWNSAGKNKQAAWCWIEKDGFNGKIKGKLYNFYAVNDSRGLAPKGWHIPTDSEWLDLQKNLGANAGLKLKSNSGWSNDLNGNNESKLAFFPEGKRDYKGMYLGYSLNGYWWSSTETTTKKAWCFILNYKNNNFEKVLTAESNGFSVRCVKD